MNASNASPPPLPDWLAERALLDEVPARARDQVDRARATEPEDYQRQLDALSRDNERILADLPTADVVAEISRRLQRVTDDHRSRWPAWALPALAAVAAVALFVWVRAPGPDTRQTSQSSGVATERGTAVDPGPDPGHRVKGEPRLVIHKQVGTSSQALASGDQIRAGDRLQLYYAGARHTGGAYYGAILSIDGRGTVTVHFPDSDQTGQQTGQQAGGAALMAAPLQPEGLVPLDHSYELDDAPHFEHFVLITGSRPFPVADVAAAARALAGAPHLIVSRSRPLTLSLPATLQQTWFLLGKGDDL